MAQLYIHKVPVSISGSSRYGQKRLLSETLPINPDNIELNGLKHSFLCSQPNIFASLLLLSSLFLFIMQRIKIKGWRRHIYQCLLVQRQIKVVKCSRYEPDLFRNFRSVYFHLPECLLYPWPVSPYQAEFWPSMTGISTTWQLPWLPLSRQ